MREMTQLLLAKSCDSKLRSQVGELSMFLMMTYLKEFLGRRDVIYN